MRLPGQRSRRVAAYAASFLILVAVWYALVSRNWRAVEAHCTTSAFTTLGESWVWDEWDIDACLHRFLGADPVEYGFLFSRLPETPRDLVSASSVADWAQRYGIEYSKRPLFGPIAAVLNVLIAEAGVRFPQRMFLLVAIFAAVCPLLMFHMFVSLGLRRMHAFCLTTVAVTSFSWMAVFSIPESYSLSVAATIATMITGMNLERASDDTSGSALIRHAIVTGLAAGVYAPALGGLVFVFVRVNARRRVFTEALPVGAGVAVLFLTPHFVQSGLLALEGQQEYLRNQAGLAHLIDIRLWATALAAFVPFGFVSPVEKFSAASGNLAFEDVSVAPLTFAIVVSCLLLGGVLRGLGNASVGRALVAPAVWFVGLVAFHVYFNPAEILLYGAAPICLVLYSIARALTQSVGPRSGVSVGLVFLVVASILLFMNLRSVFA